MQANKPEYYRIDGKSFLRRELYSKAVIEFPVLTVLLPGENSKYSVIDDVAAATARAEQVLVEQPDADAVAL